MSIWHDQLAELAEIRAIASDRKKEPGTVMISGLCDGAKAHIISCFEENLKPWKLVITYSEDRAKELADDCGCFLENVFLYPARDLLFFGANIQSDLISARRIDVWKHMLDDSSGCVVTTADALLDKLEDKGTWNTNILRIKSTDRINTQDISDKLSSLGYERVSEVDMRGQFTIRGGIIDIYPQTEELPVRIELWDDEIDSIRVYDPASQRSIDRIDSIDIYPAREKGLLGSCSFLKYFDFDKSLIYIDEPDRVYKRLVDVEEEYKEAVAGRLESGQITEAADIYSADDVMSELGSSKAIALSELSYTPTNLDIKHTYNIETRSISSYKQAWDMLIADIKKYESEKYKIILLTASRTRTERLAESLREYGLSAYLDSSEDGSIAPGHVLVTYGNLHKGFAYDSTKLVVISESDIYGTKKKKKRKKSKYDGSKISSLSELEIGDYVVHEDHGIGIYRGIEKIVRANVTKDYIKIEYLGGDNCYIPATALDIIQKYSGAEARKPKLSRLGGAEWTKTKSKVRGAVETMAKDLVLLYADRLHGKGYKYSPDTVWQREFEELFAYEETEDQKKAIEDTKADMEQGKIMDRLVCGDVGYGKTEVALRAAFKAVQDGKQVIYLVPTTLLATQHYHTFLERMESFPVRVDLLCRFRTPSQQKKTLEDLKKGLVDIVIGTHRVLSKDIVPKDLGLLIIDEEQRFGVRHKEKLKKLRQSVDVLTLTATPIPRTLHMSLAGIRDLSVLEEPPQDRVPIQTYVMEYYDETVKEAIKREIARGGQCYYIYNRVNDIADVAAKLRQLLPDATVAFAHGKMNEKELEDIMYDFINGKIDVLVSTTIIETGIDIPNVNTIIIQNADRFGLSQLYQLRGRVGRSSRAAYAFLLYKRDKLISEEAQKRLKAIKEFTELGSGIKIAMRDLEIRGAGSVLGSMQHGHMQAVGYDMYCKLLNTAVKKLRGESVDYEEYDTSIDVDMDAYIPSSYIKSEEQKLDIYKRIAAIETDDDMMDMQDELIDRFGEMPQPVINLLTISKLRSMAHRAYITDVHINKQEIKLKLYNKAKLNPEKMPELIASYKGNMRIIKNEEVALVYTERKKQFNCEWAIKRTTEIVEKLLQMV